jgi:tRNA (guanine37-N1)-methyltransferase
MNSPGVVVPRSQGEEVRLDLVASGLFRPDLEILHEGENLVLPIDAHAGDVPPSWGTVVVRDFRPVARRGASNYRDLLSWPESEKDALPRSFDVVGEIVLIRLPPELRDRKNQVGGALLRFVPGARLVGLDLGVHGPERRRSVERIAGDGTWRTRHRENGLEFEVDVERAYFSPRLAREHARFAEAVRPGDRVYDLCCGVGPFALAVARSGRAREVTAVDANPAAIDLLQASLTRARLERRVRVVHERLETFLPTAEPVERVVINLPHEGIKYLPSVARTVASGGGLYYYEVVSRTDFAGRGSALVKLLTAIGTFSVAAQRVVHPYSPTADLVAFEFGRTG